MKLPTMIDKYIKNKKGLIFFLLYLKIRAGFVMHVKITNIRWKWHNKNLDMNISNQTLKTFYYKVTLSHFGKLFR